MILFYTDLFDLVMLTSLFMSISPTFQKKKKKKKKRKRKKEKKRKNTAEQGQASSSS